MIQTARLVLVVTEARPWHPLRAMLSSPDVMAKLARDPTVQSAGASLRRQEQYRAQHGLGFWMVEAGGEVAGFCGLKPGAGNTPIAGELEIGWIFARRFRGPGAGRRSRTRLSRLGMGRARGTALEYPMPRSVVHSIERPGRAG